MYSFRVDGTPAPQGSKKAFNRGGRCVLVESSKKVKPWRESVAKAAKENIPEPLKGPIKLEVEFIMRRTKAMGTKEAPPMIQTPDTDKCVRSVADALSGVAFADDKQITTIIAGKRRADPNEPTGAKIRISNDESGGRVL